jgi:4'-phosphopantetheinyl transferase
MEKLRVFLAKIPDNFILPENWLSGVAHEKYMRLGRLRNDKDKHLTILAHRLLCYALYTQLGIQPSAQDWAYGWHGKPYLKNAPYVHFNISHSGDMAMCVLHSAPVGADIERVDAVDDVTAWRIMSKQELFAFDKAQDKNNLFYKIWTLKEAYIKYNGRGICTDLHSLTVYPEGDIIVTNLSGCQFALIDTIPGYQAAVCASDVSHSLSWVSKQSLDQF